MRLIHPHFTNIPHRDETDPEVIANLLRKGYVEVVVPPVEDEPEPVPDVVPAWRVHALLEKRGLTNTIAAMIEAMPPEARAVARAQFLRATEFERDHPLVQAVASKLEIDVDEFFKQAMNLNPGVFSVEEPGIIDRIKAWWNT